MGLLHLQGAFVSYLTQFPRIPVRSVMYFYLHFRDEEQRSWEMSQYLKFSQLSKWRNQNSHLDLWIQSPVVFLLKYSSVTTILPHWDP